MTLEEKLLRIHSRKEAGRIAAWAGRDRRRFRQLMRIFLGADGRAAQMAAWSVGICSESNPEFLLPYLGSMIARAQQPRVHDAVVRCIVRSLQWVEIPEKLLGRVTTLCFDFLSSARSPVAVKACSMTALDRISAGRPELRRELRLVVEQQLPFAQAAILARARLILGRSGRESRDE